MYNVAIALHVLAVVIWVGGMIFAYRVLRPVAAEQLEPPARLNLWVGVFNNFFPIVWVSIVLILISGYYIIFDVYGGMSNAPLYVHAMNGLGLIMMAVFAHVFFAPYKRLKKAVAAEDWAAGGKSLNQIRMLVLINSALGTITILVATLGGLLAQLAAN